MTRKKYDRDTEGEAIAEVYGRDDSSDDEEEVTEPYDPCQDLQKFMDEHIPSCGSACWITKWFSAVDIIKIFELEENPSSKQCICRYLFPFETNDDVNDLLDIVWAMLETCRLEPTLTHLYTATLELLAERTKYYYVNDTVRHRSIVNKNFFN
jgi:hypothetical protein